MATTVIREVGFIGLGRMGRPMADNILQAGFPLVVYNRTAEKMKPLTEKGARGVRTPKEATSNVDAVITCLMDDQSVLDNVTGDQGILAGLKPGGIHIGTATISPAAARKLAQVHQSHGSFYVSAPIFGRPDAAESGTLLTYVAGNPEVIAACEPLFRAYSRAHIYMGDDPALVSSIKLTMNFMLISLVEMFSQVYTFTEKSGIDPEFTQELIKTVLTHPVMDEYTERIRIRDFEPAAFALRAGFKDVELMLKASSEIQAPLPFASVIREKFITALALGMGDHDWSAISEISRRGAGAA